MSSEHEHHIEVELLVKAHETFEKLRRAIWRAQRLSDEASERKHSYQKDSPAQLQEEILEPAREFVKAMENLEGFWFAESDIEEKAGVSE